MSCTYFIADVHLSEQRPDISALFVHFLHHQASDADALYVLGDLFDYWIGDDYQNALISQVKQALKALTSQLPVYFIGGNRDFLIGQRFARETGVTLLPEHSVIDLYGESVLIMHGDTLCTRDEAYQKFRKTSRRWWWQKLMLALPLWVRIKIAQRFRTYSQKVNTTKKNDIMDVTPEEVLKQMHAHHVRWLIHGHTHRPAVHRLTLSDGQQGLRIVLGDWYQQGSLLKCEPGQEPVLLNEALPELDN